MTPQSLFPTVVCSLAASWLALSSFAAPGEEPQPSSLIETATVEARPLDRATAAVSVMERDEIEALGARSVAELIRHIPGLNLVSSGPRGGLAFAQVRGGDPNFTVVLLDGVPLNDTTDQLGGAVNLNAISTAVVERIEVARGPLSSHYGSAGLSGAINIITRQGAESNERWNVEAGTGSDDAINSSVAFHDRGERSDSMLAASWDEESERVADDSFEQFALHGQLGVPTGERGEIRLSGRATRWEAEDYPDASGGPLLGTGATRASEHDEISLGAEWRYGSAEVQPRVYAKLYRHELDRGRPEIPPGPSGFVPAAIEHTTFDSVRVGWVGSQLSWRALRTSIGTEVSYESGRNDSTLFLPPEFGGPADGSYREERWVAGLLAETFAEIGPMLYELTLRVDGPEEFDVQISPRLGAIYRLSSGATRLRAAAGRAFKLPSFFALSSPPALGGNPDLEPEISVGADAGIEHTFARAHLDLGLTLFWSRFEDLINFDFATFSLVNEERVVSEGAELSIGWRPTAWLTLHGTATTQDVENEESDVPLRQRPEHVGAARVILQPIDSLRWAFDGQWVSETFDEQIPVGPGVVSGYSIFGTALTLDLGRDWQLQARVENLTDEEYETFLGFPGPDRGFRAGLRYRASAPVR